ncbi:MAG: ArsA-related P-loop ATPase [Thermoanaerobaculia bacterium]
MDLASTHPPLVVVVGGGGVGKTTLAAALGLVSAGAGLRTLVMTFDPSLRLKDALGVGVAAKDLAVTVPGTDGGAAGAGRLDASLLDARVTFDRLVARYAPDEAARQRILTNPYYDHLAGHLGGILEYMAVERLYEVAREGRYDRIILDTPPTSQAIEFLGAPQRIVDFLDSGALKIALKDWFDDRGHLRAAPSSLGFLSRGIEKFLDRVVGVQLLRDMSEFFRAFAPLFTGFRQRAERTKELLVSSETLFVLVTGPGESRIPDTLFFARRLRETGHHLGPVVVNRLHPQLAAGDAAVEDGGRRLFHWLGERHRRGFEELRTLMSPDQTLVALPLTPDELTDLESLTAFGRRFQQAVSAAS